LQSIRRHSDFAACSLAQGKQLAFDALRPNQPRRHFSFIKAR
jgi:hypothetical protein